MLHWLLFTSGENRINVSLCNRSWLKTPVCLSAQKKQSHNQYERSTCNNTDLVIRPGLMFSHSIAHYSLILLEHFWRMDSTADHSARWSLKADVP